MLPGLSTDLLEMVDRGAIDPAITSALRTLPYVRHAPHTVAGQIANDWLSRSQIDVQSSKELEPLETVASVVAHGLGVSVAPNICMPSAIFASLRRIP